MSIELKVPAVGESITEVLLVRWFKKVGQPVQKDEPLVEIETDKATFELPAPVAGALSRIVKGDGQTAEVGEVVGFMEEGAAAAEKSEEEAPVEPAAPAEPVKERRPAEQIAEASKPSEPQIAPPEKEKPTAAPSEAGEPRVMPAAQREMAERGIGPEQVEATGPGGRILKEDVIKAAERKAGAAPTEGKAAETPPPAAEAPVAPPAAETGNRYEEAVPMSPMRKRIAERLVAAQQTTALLTTINEIDMSAVMTLRSEYRETFQNKYNIKLGFMSFFIKACVDALKQYPQINAEVRGTDIVYHNYYDIGIAVSGGKGLVVPVIRNAERLSFAEIEMAVADFGSRARENKITLEELKGGTFTITNGGIFGSLLSTPIINPPQSGILGMHAIQDRPVARDGQIVIRPMMYVALTYDHRIVDGREAVTFLKRIKEDVEDPSRMLIEI